MRSVKKEVSGADPGNQKLDEMNDSLILENKHLPVKDESNRTTIRRGKHDREHPYVYISKAMLRDSALSIREKGALCYLLSLPDDWVTHPRQVADAIGIGKDQMYAILKALIEAGYATRSTQKFGEGRFAQVEYQFFEEKLAKPQIIKENITVSEIPDTVFPHAVNQTLLKNDSTDKIPNSLLKVPKGTEERVDKNPTDSFSSEVLETSQLMIDAMRIIKPDYSAQNGKLLGILTEVDRMIRLDKRNAAKIVEVFRWALADNFWADKMFKPNPAKYLREKFDQLEMKMNSETVDECLKPTVVKDDKPSLTQRLKGRYTYITEFGNYTFTSKNGHFGGKISVSDPDALESWLKDKGL